MSDILYDKDLYDVNGGASVSPHNTTSKRHTVKKGEDLSAVARRYNMTVAELCSLNNFSETVKLNPGTVILIR